MSDLGIGETDALGRSDNVFRKRRTFEAMPFGTDLRDLGEEPRVDPRLLCHGLDRNTGSQCRFDGEDAVGRRVRCARKQLGRRAHRVLPVAVQTGPVLLERADRFLQRLFERAPDAHRFADGLHRAGERRVGTGELLEREARDLRDHVVDRRLERRQRLLGDVVRDLVEAIPDGQLGRDLRDREPGRFGCKRARARHARVHLDDDLASGLRVDGELDVRAAGVDADRADAADRCVSHLLVLDVGQGLLRRDGDRVAGVHAHRIDVLDRADDHDVVGEVPHHFELELFPAEDALFDQHFADPAARQAFAGDAVEPVLAVGEAAPRAAQHVRRADDNRVPDLFRQRARFVE